MLLLPEAAVRKEQPNRPVSKVSKVSKPCTRETVRAAAITTADAALRSLSLVARTDVGDASTMFTTARDATQRSPPNLPGIVTNGE